MARHRQVISHFSKGSQNILIYLLPLLTARAEVFLAGASLIAGHAHHAG